MAPTYDPRNRASTIFPVLISERVKPKVIFLGYWSMKNGLADYFMQCTLRASDGSVLDQKQPDISECRAYGIDIRETFRDQIDPDQVGFSYSVEVEIFFKEKPLFNFPALTLVHESDAGSSCVHSSIRSYDEGESPHQESMTFPQAGFDVYQSSTCKSLLIFTSAKPNAHYQFDLLFERTNHPPLETTVSLQTQSRGELCQIDLTELLRDTLNADEGCYAARIVHNVDDFFPRFYCANLNDDCYATLTHSFFDTSTTQTAEHAFVTNDKRDDFFDSVFSIPVILDENIRTDIVSYDCNAPFDGQIQLEAFDADGNLLYADANASAQAGFLQSLSTLHLGEWLQSNCPALADAGLCSVQVSYRGTDDAFPQRLKYGLNIYNKGAPERGSNICFGSTCYTDQLREKSQFRKWGPVGGPARFLYCMINTRLNVRASKVVTAMNFRIINTEGACLNRSIPMADNATVCIDPANDPELSSFLGTDYGWVFATGATNVSSGWFLSLGQDNIGGDHSF